MSPAAERLSPPAGGELAIRHIVLIGDGLGDLARLQQKAPGALEGKLMPGRREPWQLSVMSRRTDRLRR